MSDRLITLRENIADEPAAPSLPDLLRLLTDPKAGVQELAAAAAKHDAARKAHMAAEAKAAKATAQSETMLQEVTAEIAAREAAFDKRCAAREVELSAREKRAADLMAKAEADNAKAAEIRASYERRQRAWDAA
jgi:hypothetical protein